VTISRSRFTDNTAQNGGGLRVFSGGDFQTSLTMTDCVVSGNHADGGRIVTGAGGGLSASVSAPSSVSGCTFSHNTAHLGAGVAVNSSTNPFTIRNSTISGNWAMASGGGVACSGTVVIHNSTIAFNQAGLDGTSGGGGIVARQGGPTPGSLRLESTIVAHNSDAGGHPDLAPDTTPITATNCLIGSTPGASNFTADAVTLQLLGLDPLLAPLASNGGPTQTLALKKGSPCIDRG